MGYWLLPPQRKPDHTVPANESWTAKGVHAPDGKAYAAGVAEGFRTSTRSESESRSPASIWDVELE